MALKPVAEVVMKSKVEQAWDYENTWGNEVEKFTDGNGFFDG